MPLILLLGCAPDCEDPGFVCTLAGEGTPGFNGTGLPPLETWLSTPSALAVDPQGRPVIVDFNNFLLRRFDGEVLEVIAGTNEHDYAVPGPALESPLENPIDADFDEEGNLFVAEYHGLRILRIDAAGNLEVWAGTGEQLAGEGPRLGAGMGEPTGVAADAGRVVISDPDFDRLILVEDDIARTLDVPVSGPQRLDLEGDRLRVADAEAGQVLEVDLSSGEWSVILDGLDQPTGVDGDLVAETGAHRVVDLQGAAVCGTGAQGFLDGPCEEALLNAPMDLAVDGSTVWVMDTLNARLRAFQR